MTISNPELANHIERLAQEVAGYEGFKPLALRHH